MQETLENALKALENANYAEYFEEMDKCEMTAEQKEQYSNLKNKFIFENPSWDITQKLKIFAQEVGRINVELLGSFFLPEKLGHYLQTVIENFKQWQDFFVHIRGKDIKQIDLQAREINVFSNVREGTVEELRENISQHEKRMVILGEPGMGKSTSMQYLAQKDARKLLDSGLVYSIENRIPLYLELRYVTDTILDLIIEEIGQYIESVDKAKSIEKMLSDGIFTLFLDGLNETIKDKNHQIADQIPKFYQKYSNCVYLVSSRPQDYLRRPFSKIPVFNLVPMNIEQQEEFLNRNANAEVRQIIQKQVEVLPNLSHFLAVPLFLVMLIRVVEKTKKVPKNEALIVEEFLEGIYFLEEQKNRHFNKLQTNILLAHLAKHYFAEYNGNAKVPYSKVAEYLRQKAQTEGFSLNPLEFLQKMVELQILDSTRDRYAFKHQLFLDYFFGRDNEIEFE